MRKALDRLVLIPESALVVLAFALRAAFALKLGQRFHQTDEVGFFEVASQFARLGVVGKDGAAAIAAPVPAVFFGSFYRWLGPSYAWPRLAQAVIGAAAAAAIGRLARRWSGSEAAGRLALLIAAIYPFYVYYGGMLMSETLYASACAGAFCLLAASIDGDAPLWTAAGAGLLLAAAALTRIEGAGAGAAVLAGGAALCLARRWSWKAWAAGALAFALPLLAWAARNRADTGRFALDDHGGITLVHGTVLYDLCERYDTAVAMNQAAKEEWFQRIQALPEGQRQAAYAAQALQFMREHPRQTAVQWAKKFFSFWRFYPRVDKIYYETNYSDPGAGLGRLALVAVSLLFEPWLILLGAAGFWVLRREPVALPLFLFVASTTAAHVLVVSMMRYRLPVMAVLIAASAGVIARLAGSDASTSSGRPAAK